MVTVRRIATHPVVNGPGPGHAGAYFGTNESLNVARPGNQQAGAISNQLAGIYITGPFLMQFDIELIIVINIKSDKKNV